MIFTDVGQRDRTEKNFLSVLGREAKKGSSLVD